MGLHWNERPHDADRRRRTVDRDQFGEARRGWCDPVLRLTRAIMQAPGLASGPKAVERAAAENWSPGADERLSAAAMPDLACDPGRRVADHFPRARRVAGERRPDADGRGDRKST